MPRESSGVEIEERVEIRRPAMYRVILLNDDYTTMDFVVAILESVFNKTPAEAVRIMLQVHKGGQGMCGVYPKQIAEAKISMVQERARTASYPLRCVMEKE